MKPLRVAFPLLGRGGWTGGYVYLLNTLRLIRSRLGDQIEAHVFLSPEEAQRYGAELSPLVDGRMIVDPAIAGVGRGSSLARALLTGRDSALERILAEARIDAAFENASFYGWKFAIPVISWIPDFQHRHMPEMFSRRNWWHRDIGFRIEIGSGRTIMLSSETARRDLASFYGGASAHVVRFAIDLDIAPHIGRGAEMCATYGLPERFFYLPNQFWRHKNHACVVSALAQLKAEGALESIPPIVLSGQPKDPRNPAHFDELMQRAVSAGVESRFRYLGLIPYDHVLALNAACYRMINPSRFEGWSTPIEEAKAFSTPLLLSDIAIHREQAPLARFFDPASPATLTTALVETAKEAPAPRPSLDALVAAQNVWLDAHAAALLATVRDATGKQMTKLGAR